MIVPLGLSLYQGGDLYDMILIRRQISHLYEFSKVLSTFQILGEMLSKR